MQRNCPTLAAPDRRPSQTEAKMKNLASKGPPKGSPMKNLVCNEKFGINCASAEAQFGTGRGINLVIGDIFCQTAEYDP